MSIFFKDLRYATRMLASSPGFTAAAIICLALGIGATTAIFSVVHAVLMRPLGYREPAKLIRLYTEFPGFPNGGLRRFWTSPPEYLEMARDLKSWENLDAFATGGINLAGAAEPIRATSCIVTGGMFTMLGVAPELGRFILPADDVQGAGQVIVLSHDLWQRMFAADKGILGRMVQVNGQNAQVVGVMPPGFTFPPGDLNPPEVWLPAQLGPVNPQRRGNHFLYPIGRLKAGVSRVQAEQEIERYVNESGARVGAMQHAFDPKNHPVVMFGLQDEVVRGIRPALWTLLGAVAFVLLIACVNVANLLLARAEARQREIAIRKALGAGVGQLVRQFTVEGLLLSLGGAVAGLGLALAGLKVLVAAGKASIPRADEVSVDPTVLAVTLGVSLLTAVFFGLAPLAQIIAGSLHDALKAAGGRTLGSIASNRFRSVLVASELALALVLLIGTGLMIRAFWKLTEVNPGYRPGGLLTLRMNLPQATYPKTENVTRFWQTVEDKVATLPGVTGVTPMFQLPPERAINANDTFIEGFTPVQGGPGHNIDYWQFTGENFFQTMGVRLIEGRFIDSRDVADSSPAMVINQTLARTYYGNQSPLGKRIKPGGTGAQTAYFTVVGVVEDIKNAGLDKPAGTELFIPFRQQGYVSRTFYLVIRTGGDPSAMISPVRAAIRDIDPSLPLSQVRTMDEVLDNVRSRPKFLTSLLGIFSSVALVLAAVGLYGVISYSVARRTTEFGVRMAMGAQTGDVLRLVIRQGLTLALCGVGLGAAGAIGLTRLMRSNGLLFEVSAFDPVTFISMAAVLVAVTALACMVPARRATRVDPLVALRYE